MTLQTQTGTRAGRGVAVLLLMAVAGTCASGQVVDASWLGLDGFWSMASRWDSDPYAPNNGTPPGTSYRAIFGEDLVNPFLLEADVNIEIDALEFASAQGDLWITPDRFAVLGDAYVRAGTVHWQGTTIAGGTWHTEGSGRIVVESGGSTVADNARIDGDILLSRSRLEAVNGWHLTGTARVGERGASSSSLDLASSGMEQLTSGRYEVYDSSMSIPSLFEIGPDVTISLEFGSRLSGGAELTHRGVIEVVNGRGELSAEHLENFGVLREVSGLLDARFLTFANRGLIASEDGLAFIEANSGVNFGTMEASGRGRIEIESSFFVNETLIVARDGGVVQLGIPNSGAPRDSWRNDGTIRLIGGELDLGDSFRLDQIGRVEFDDASRINIIGELDLRNDVLRVGDDGPRWGIDGGRVYGGSITTSGGRALEVVGTDGQLFGVDLSGTLDLAGNGANITLEEMTHAHDLLVVTSAVQPQLKLQGEHLFERVDLLLSRPDPDEPAAEIHLRGLATLTLDADSSLRGTVRVEPGQSSSGGTFVNQGYVGADQDGEWITFVNRTTRNDGLMEVTDGGILALYSDSTHNAGVIEVRDGLLRLGQNPAETSWTNTGTIDAYGGVTGLDGSFTVSDLDGLRRLGGEVALLGSMDLEGGTFVLDASRGSWTLGTQAANGNATLHNGRFELRDGSELIPVHSWLTLRDVSFVGDIDAAGHDVLFGFAGLVDIDGTWRSSELLQFEDGVVMSSGAVEGTSARVSGAVETLGATHILLTAGVAEFGSADPTLRNDGWWTFAFPNDTERHIEFVTIENSGVLEFRENSRAEIDGDLYSSGVIRIGPRARLEQDSLELTDTSVLEFVLGAADGNASGRLRVLEDDIIAGTLQFRLSDSYIPRLYDTFDVFSGDVAEGSFWMVLLPSLPGRLEWDSSQLFPGGRLEIVPAPGGAGILLVVMGVTASRRRR